MPTPGPLPTSYWVLENQLLAGPYPGSSDDEEARERVGWLLDAGVRVFVDLTERGELLPYDAVLKEEGAARGIEVEHVRAPIQDLGVPTDQELARTLARIDEALQAGTPVYVHCWGGIGRTGTVIGCWLIRHRLASADTVLEVIQTLRNADEERRQRRAPETTEQIAMVVGWKE